MLPWVEVFAVLVVGHLVGDFVLQTEFQALNKFGGLSSDPVRRKALLCHVATYLIPIAGAVLWIALDDSVALALVILAAIPIAHLVQDDGRLLATYVRRVKKTEAPPGSPLWMAVDQTLHVVVLFGAALLAAAG